jgi:hypothetical protein
MNNFDLVDNVLQQYNNISNKTNLSIFFKPFLYHIKKNNKTYMHFFVENIYNNKNNLYSYLFTSLQVDRKTLNEIYIKILKIYNALRRLVYLYKKRKFETVIETDLMLNNIDSNSKNVLCIVQNKKKYLFYIFELLKIVYNSLSNSEFFFSEPLEIKNPYNNIKFEYHNLCNIYFFMKFNCIQFSDIFYRYFKCHFDNKIFLHRNFNYLRECNIKKYVYNNDKKEYLYIEIMNMINNYNNRIEKRYSILIHEEFPIDILYNIMKPYLYLYINAWYSYIQYESETFSKELNHRLFYFQKYNPQFGRLKYRIIRKYCFKRNRIIIKTIKTFDEKHIDFMCNLNMSFDGHYKYINLFRDYIRNNRVIKYDDNENLDTETDDDDDDDDDEDENEDFIN